MNQIKTLEQLKDSSLLYEKKLPAFGYVIMLTTTIFLLIVAIWGYKTPKIYIVTSSGVVKSDNKNYIMSPYTGEITEMYIQEGSIVEKGEALFTIKSTDLDVQVVQLEEQKETYEIMVGQYEKLVQSIQDDTNYFDSTNSVDSLYYSQFEAYKSQILQNQVDASTYKSYGYTDEQIEAEHMKNQSKITEIYYTSIETAERSMLEANIQLDTINAQMKALESGQGAYMVTAKTSGIVHMLSDYDEGMVVQAASAVASIASEQDSYTVVANVSTLDAARIGIGDTVEMVISGLAQSIYGTLKGTVTNMDSDMTAIEGENNTYVKIYIEPETTYLVSKEGNKINISNGMTVETRIQYDEVTYFYYVMEALGVLTR